MFQNHSNVSSRYSKSYKLILLPILCLLLSTELRAQDVFSVGPTINFNFGDKKPKLGWGVEASLWWYENTGIPISANLGFDHRKGSTVLYTQAQTGIAIAGISAGPYLELRKGDAPALGLQTDYWLNYYAGINYRVRYGNGENQKSLGFYLKAPINIGVDADDDDDDWDWD